MGKSVGISVGAPVKLIIGLLVGTLELGVLPCSESEVGPKVVGAEEVGAEDSSMGSTAGLMVGELAGDSVRFSVGASVG